MSDGKPIGFWARTASEEELALLDRILGKNDVLWGPDCHIVTHTTWNPDSVSAAHTKCVSYCQRCVLEKRILEEWRKR